MRNSTTYSRNAHQHPKAWARHYWRTKMILTDSLNHGSASNGCGWLMLSCFRSPLECSQQLILWEDRRWSLSKNSPHTVSGIYRDDEAILISEQQRLLPKQSSITKSSSMRQWEKGLLMLVRRQKLIKPGTQFRMIVRPQFAPLLRLFLLTITSWRPNDHWRGTRNHRHAQVAFES